ncbi:MAG: DUF6600 domain-containing protein, partial [Ferruginibacter sp.]
MKTLKLSFIVLAAFVSIMPVTETKAQSVAVSVNFNTFQQELSPYGRWMNNPRFGQVWIFNEPGFKPYYTNGHWEYTNYGWSWESDYDWGWAPFHYGRWEQDPFHGWMWIPGYEWASAWVSWSSYDDYYGWAPLGYGININVSFGAVPYDRWNFIPRRYISDRYVNRYCVPHYGNNNFRRAVVINNYYNGNNGVGRYGRGPQRREAERYTGNRISERRIDYTDRNRNRGQNAGNSNFSNGRRNNDGANQSNNPGGLNNRRRNDVNRDDNATTSSDNQNRREQNSINRPGRRQTGEANPNNNGENGNNPRRRELNQSGNNNTTPPVIENRRPSRDVNPVPQTNESNNPGRRPYENRMNRRNDQQNNAPQQQRYERPAPTQRPQMERPAPQQQRFERPAPQQRPQMERSAPQQQSAPQMEQRRMERRSDNGAG